MTLADGSLQKRISQKRYRDSDKGQQNAKEYRKIHKKEIALLKKEWAKNHREMTMDIVKQFY